jgi:hypothetical protein
LNYFLLYCYVSTPKDDIVNVETCVENNEAMEAHSGYETLRVPHYLDNLLTDGGKIVSLTRRPPFNPPGRFLVLVFLRGCESTPRP